MECAPSFRRLDKRMTASNFFNQFKKFCSRMDLGWDIFFKT